MEEKKKGKGTIVIIVLLVFVILGLVCYICYDKGIIFKGKESTTNANEKSKTKNEEEKVTFSDSELEKYVNYISPVSLGPSALLYDTGEVNAKSLSASDKIKYIGSSVYQKQQGMTHEQFLNEGKGKYDGYILENEVKSLVENVYGPNTYEKAVFNLGCGDYILDEEKGKYYTKTGCGGATTTSVSNVIIEYKATKNKLEITTSYAFVGGADNKIYKDYNMSIILDDYTGRPDEVDTYLKNYIKNNKDKLSTIVYTFESTDGRNYYFTGFKNNK